MGIGGGSITVTTMNIVQPADVSVDFPDFPEYPSEILATLTGVYGKWKNAVITITTDTDLSAEVDLGAPFHHMQIQIPAIDAADVAIQVAEESDGTFYTLGNGTALILAGEGSFITTVMLGGYRYVKVKTTNPQSEDRTFRVRGSNV